LISHTVQHSRSPYSSTPSSISSPPQPQGIPSSPQIGQSNMVYSD